MITITQEHNDIQTSEGEGTSAFNLSAEATNKSTAPYDGVVEVNHITSGDTGNARIKRSINPVTLHNTTIYPSLYSKSTAISNHDIPTISSTGRLRARKDKIKPKSMQKVS